MSQGGDVRSLLQVVGVDQMPYHELREEHRGREAIRRWPLIRVTVRTLADASFEAGDVPDALLVRGRLPPGDGSDE